MKIIENKLYKKKCCLKEIEMDSYFILIGDKEEDRKICILTNHITDWNGKFTKYYNAIVLNESKCSITSLNEDTEVFPISIDEIYYHIK